MKFNKEQLDALIALPDDALWAEVIKLAKGYGVALPEKTPSHQELMKLRGVVSGSQINMFEAMKLLNEYKKGCR